MTAAGLSEPGRLLPGMGPAATGHSEHRRGRMTPLFDRRWRSENSDAHLRFGQAPGRGGDRARLSKLWAAEEQPLLRTFHSAKQEGEERRSPRRRARAPPANNRLIMRRRCGRFVAIAESGLAGGEE